MSSFSEKRESLLLLSPCPLKSRLDADPQNQLSNQLHPSPPPEGIQISQSLSNNLDVLILQMGPENLFLKKAFKSKKNWFWNHGFRIIKKGLSSQLDKGAALEPGHTVQLSTAVKPDLPTNAVACCLVSSPPKCISPALNCTRERLTGREQNQHPGQFLFSLPETLQVCRMKTNSVADNRPFIMSGPHRQELQCRGEPGEE